MGTKWEMTKLNLYKTKWEMTEINLKKIFLSAQNLEPIENTLSIVHTYLFLLLFLYSNIDLMGKKLPKNFNVSLTKELKLVNSLKQK